ncbi:MAG: hypothetical protein ACOCQR_03880 [bacterium]
MFNKKLQQKVKELEDLFKEKGTILRVDCDRLKDRIKEIENKVKKIEKGNDERWEMLKDYLNVEEEKYTEMKKKSGPAYKDYSSGKFSLKTPAQKTRLIKKKKK